MDRSAVTLGLRENWRQFLILVIINAFVGGMVGLERTLLPQLAEEGFGIEAKTAILSFIVVFGITKALTNYLTGSLANAVGRKNLLIIGWLFGLPVPLILMYAGDWNWIIFANLLLGINQGLTWSSTVVMKIDIVGEKQRGLAMGLNEFAGYLAVAVVAFFTGWMASEYGLRPYPFLIGLAFALAGLLGSWFLVKDTRGHVKQESTTNAIPRLKHVFRETTWQHRNLGSVTQAGLVNNLNDGMAWGLLPILLAGKGFPIQDIGVIVAIYPAVWGIGQLVTGKLSDVFCKKDLLYSGMVLQGLALLVLPWASTYLHFVLLAAILGWGTAMVYPTFLATIAENTHPSDRAKSLGIFRLWRDSGYAFGALLTGILSDQLGIGFSVVAIGLLTVLSGLVIFFRMKCSDPTSMKFSDLFALGRSGTAPAGTCGPNP